MTTKWVQPFLLLVAASFACGSADAPAAANPDAGASGATAAQGGSGGAGSGGDGGTGGSGGGGGTTSTGGAAGSGVADASRDAPAVCFGDGGKVVAAAKACSGSDSDCYLFHVVTCCGPDLAIGLSKNAREYEACFPQAIGPNACGGLGCAKLLATASEDGQTTENGGAPVARCMMYASGPTCMTQMTYPPGSGDK